jgi:hypothetical protein
MEVAAALHWRVTVFESGNSAGLDTVVDCTFGDEVSTIALVRE